MRRLVPVVVLAVTAAGCGGSGDPVALQDAAVTSIEPAQDGTVWLGGADGTLTRVRSGRVGVVPLPNGASGPIALGPDGEGVLVAAGPVLASCGGGTCDTVAEVADDATLTAVADRAAPVIAGGVERHTGRGFVIDGTGVTIVLHDVASVIPSASAVVDLVAEGEGVWVATAAAGVVWTDGTLWRIDALQTGRLRDDHVFDLAPDPDGGVWVATQSGATHLDGDAFTHAPAGAMPDPRTRSIAATHAAVWVGTHGGGIARLDRSSGFWTTVRPAGVGAAVTAIEAREGEAWAATAGDGLVHVDQTGAVTEYGVEAGLEGPVTSLAIGRDGAVWAGSDGGAVVRVEATGVGGRLVVHAGASRPPDHGADLDGDVVSIPAGPFEMGSDRHRPDEAPQRTVTLGEFVIHRHEVTNAQYERYVEATGAPHPSVWPGRRIPSGEDLHPVVGIRPREAIGYCEWLGMRLPTEAEWERAARGVDGRDWPWGGVWDPQRANTAAGGPGWTVPVGSYPTGASPEGLLDVAGNAAEWVSDYYDPGYYATAPDLDPPGPAAVTDRVRRGGSWAAPPDEARVSRRTGSHGASPDLRAGFRCAGSP